MDNVQGCRLKSAHIQVLVLRTKPQKIENVDTYKRTRVNMMLLKIVETMQQVYIQRKREEDELFKIAALGKICGKRSRLRKRKGARCTNAYCDIRNLLCRYS